ncbi:MAG: hypothetical protein K2P57_05050 [Burkholderiales bacterium]|nr:hypothetical protein [Burkholderiales bacterium]
MIAVALKPSMRLALLLVAVHLGAILFMLQVSYLLAALLAFSMAYSVMHYALLSLSGSIVALRIGKKTCTVFTRGGDESNCTLQGSTYVSPWLTVLNLKGAGRLAKTAVILPDAIDGEAFRQLRVWLRWK